MRPDKTPENSVVVVIDAYSTGKLPVETLKQLGWGIIHVHSARQPDSLLSKLGVSDRANFIGNLVYEGNIHALIDGIKAVAKDRSVEAVISGCECSVELTDELSEAMRLPTSNGTQFSAAKRDKYEMRRAVSRAGLKVPQFWRCDNFSDLCEGMRTRNINYPVVIKPLRSAGSDGVVICRNEAEARAGVNRILEMTNIFEIRNQSFLVEEFLAGTELVVNTISCDGEHYTTDVKEYVKHSVAGKGVVYDSETLLEPNSARAKAASAYAHKVIDALGIRFGATHAEIMMLDDSTPVLVEIAARLAGTTHIPSSVMCLGLNPVKLLIDSFLDPAAFKKQFNAGLPPRLNNHSTIIFASTTQSGTLEREKFSAWENKPATVQNMKLLVSPGCEIQPTENLLTSPAWFFLVGTKEEIERDSLIIREFCRTALIVRPHSHAEDLFDASTKPDDSADEIKSASDIAPLPTNP